jgi:hypothetical protein
METLVPIRFSSGDKLMVLRRLDRHGGWISLDDHHFCLRCEQEFSGRQIDIVGGTRERGRLRLLCPTDGCDSTCEDWVRVATKEKPVCLSHGGHVVGIMGRRRQLAAVDGHSELGIETGAILKKVTRLFRSVRAASRA